MIIFMTIWTKKFLNHHRNQLLRIVIFYIHNNGMAIDHSLLKNVHWIIIKQGLLRWATEHL